jgi:parallel beta-helix repeat protein
VGPAPVVVSGPSTAGSNSVPAPAHTTIATALNTGLDSDTNAPTIKSVVAAAGGSLTANATYYYKITTTYAGGESTASNEVPAATGGAGSQSLNLTWTAAQGATATGYNIYRGTAPGAENVLVAHVPGSATSFQDKGASPTPAANTSGLSIPAQQPVAMALGGTLATGTYYYKITAISATGETLASNERSGATNSAAGLQTLNLAWNPVPGAIGYDVYRGTASNGERLLTFVAGGATTSFQDTGAASLPPVLGVFNGTGVIGNATGVGTSPQVDMMKVYLNAGDALTVQLNTKSILSPLDPTVRIFNAAGVDLTSYFQDGGQAPFGSLHSKGLQGVSNSGITSVGAGLQNDTAGLSLRQFNPNAPTVNVQNYYLSPATGQPGSDADLYYTFTPPPSAAPVMQSVIADSFFLGGGLNANTTYYYVVTAVTPAGETTASNEVALLTGASVTGAVLTWQAAPNATGYNIYRGTTAGQENVLIGSVGADQLSFFDFDSAFVSPGSPPPDLASGYYYIAISGAGNDSYSATTVTPAAPTQARANGSTGAYQVQLSVGPVNARGGHLQHGDPSLATPTAMNGQIFFGRSFPNVDDNQKVPPDNHVAIGETFYRSPDANSDDPTGGVNDATVRVVKYDQMQGDTTVTHTQGQLIIESNQINNSLNDGILVSSSPREGLVGSGNVNLPHQGSVVNLPVQDTTRLVPGTVVFNNIVNGFGAAGIQFSGDSDAQGPLAAVPFGRIVNNTVYNNSTNPSGVGILVSNSASPTIMNNIVAHTAIGISIDNSSQALSALDANSGPPQLVANLYQNDTLNTNLPLGNLGTAGIALSPSDPLFVNAQAGNFYLAPGSQAIDSSSSSLQARAALVAVTAPLGIAPSPILAPATDINGQLRGADPEPHPGSGQGSNPFVDRGAVERVDFVGPAASLLAPIDNAIADQDPRVNFVYEVGQNLGEFDILLNDGIGSGVDNNTVTQNSAILTRNGVTLTPGIDYAFVYDNNNHIIRLIAASGVWQNGNVFNISLNNSPIDGIKDLAGNPLQADDPNGTTTFQITLANVANNPPVVILPSETQKMYEHTTLAFSPVAPKAPVPSTVLHSLANSITVFDVDNNGGQEKVSLTASVGTLELIDPATGLPLAATAISGITFTGNGTAANPLVISGPLGDLNQDASGTYLDPGINVALTDLVFSLNNPADPTSYYYNGNATITVVADDLGNTPPPAKITTAILPITVIAVNDPPVTSLTNGTGATMDFPAGSAVGGTANSGGNSFVAAVNGPLAFQLVDTTGANAPINFQLDGTSTFAIAANATGADLAGQVLAVTLGGTTKTFEFVTGAAPTRSGGPTGNNIAISVLYTDNAAALAAQAANTITSAAGFNSSSVAAASGNLLTFNGALLRISTDPVVSDPAATLTSGQITPAVNAWNLDIAPNVNGADLAGQEIAITVGGVTKTFEFVTAASGNPTNANVVILANAADVAATLASDAAGAINSAFSASSVATAHNNRLTLAGITSVSLAVDGTLQDPNETLTDEYPTVPAPVLRAGMITLYTPIAFNPTDSAATVAAEVAGAINANSSIGAIIASASNNHVTLSGAVWQFAEAGIATVEDTPVTFPQTGIGGISVSDPDISGTEANDAAIQFEELVSVQSGSGTLSLGGTATGVTFLGGTQNGQSLLDFEGTLAAINQALDGLTFIPADEFVGPVHISFLTNDNGSTGVGPAPVYSAAGQALFSMQADVWLDIGTVSDAPSLANPSNPGLSLLPINETPTNPPTGVPNAPDANDSGDTVLSILQSAGGNAMTIHTVDASAKIGIAVTGLSVPTMADGLTPAGVWRYSTNGGATWQTVGSTSFTLAPTATGADLAGEVFTVSAGTITKSFEVVTGSAPARSGGPSGSNVVINVSFTDNAAQVASKIAAAINSAAGFNAPLASTLTVANGYPNGGNLLTFNGATVATSVDAAVHDPAAKPTANRAGLVAQYFNAASAVVSNNHALLLDGNDLLRFVANNDFNSQSYIPGYKAAKGAPPSASFTAGGPVQPAITFQAWDETAALNPNTNQIVPLAHGQFADLTSAGYGTGASTPFSIGSASATITVQAVNDVPVITTTTTVFTTYESTPVPLTGTAINDNDVGEGNGQVQVTITTDGSKGKLSTTSMGTVSGSGTLNSGSITLKGLLSDVNTVLNTLTFTPVQFFAGITSINFSVSDLGNAGLPLSVAQTAAKTVQVSVIAQHQAPVLDASVAPAGTPSFPAIVANIVSTRNAGGYVGAMLESVDPTDGDIWFDGQPPAIQPPATQPAVHFLDLDADAGAKQGIAITHIDEQNGIWSYSLNDGSTWTPMHPSGTQVLSTSFALLLPGTDPVNRGAMVRFQPNANFVGNATLTFQAWDQSNAASAGSHVNLAVPGATGGGTAYSTGSAVATLQVSPVNTPPSFSLHTTSTTENDTVVVPSANKVPHPNGNVIAVPNFAFGINAGAAGGPVAFTVSIDPQDAALLSPSTLGPTLSDGSSNPAFGLPNPYIDANGTLYYQLASDLFGMATLTVYATNSGTGNNTSSPQTTTLSVIAINDPPTLDPIANPAPVPNGAGQQQVPLSGISAGLDESQLLTITAVSDNPGVVPNPSVSFSGGSTGTLFYTPANGAIGTAHITVTVTDNGGTANGGVNTFTQQFTINVLGNGPTATAQSVTVAENSQQTITLSGTPGQGQPAALSATITVLPTQGTLYQTPDGTTRGAAITAVNTPVTNPQNKVIYVPNVSQTNSDSFAFTVTGGSPSQTSAPATVSISVSIVTGSVAAVADTYIISDSSGSAVSASIGVLSNDSPSGSVTARFVSPPSHGTLNLLSDGSFSYTPNASFQGYDQFSYEAVDGSSQSAPTTVTLLSHAAAVVDKVYHQVLGRAADIQGLEHWTSLIMQGEQYGAVAQGIFESSEHLDPIITKYYEQFLLREPDADGLTFWLTRYREDGGPENVVALMISSPEFFNEAAAAHPALSANAAYVTTLYERLLNREPDAQGLQFWTDKLDSGTLNRAQVVLGFEQSPEAFGNDVTGFFNEYLGRAPSSSELANYVSQLEQGASQRDIQIALINLPEYQSLPALPSPGTMNRFAGL